MLNLTPIDTIIVVVYLIATIGVGLWVSRRPHQGMRGYFLGGNQVSWQYLGLSNASGMFDIAGTMWMVYLLYVYGVKSVWIPWLWPIFNHIFSMVYLSGWLRRSGKLTGAEWITFRFGNGVGANISHLTVVLFALFNVIGFLAYGFVGIGKFVAVFFPYDLVSIFDLYGFLPSEVLQNGMETIEAKAAIENLNSQAYGLIFVLLTSIYVIKGGLKGVVFTEILQFGLMTIACIGVAFIAMSMTSAPQIAAVTPQGWNELFFDWELNFDWASIMPAVESRIEADGWNLFGVFMMMVVFKGVLQSLAGAAPNYDMQRVLATKNPVEAAKMSGMISFVLLPTRYLLITGLTVLALVQLRPELTAMGDNIDFERILPLAMVSLVPPVLLGLLLAGLISAFMSTFASTLNAAPAYIVNDIYKRYIRPDANDRHYVMLSYVVSIVFVIVSTALGLLLPSVNSAILWVVSALYGGYAAANILKWYWWRFNGAGFAMGMAAGLVAASILPFTGWSALNAFPLTFALCVLGCVVGTFMTKPTDMDTLVEFYTKTRPWGFWRPVHDEAERRDSGKIKRNSYFKSNMKTIAVGIVWQTAITACPVFLVLQAWSQLAVALSVVAICTVYLKFYWWDRLEEMFGEESLSKVPS